MKLNTNALKKKATLNDESYFTVHAFMRNELGLCGAQIIIYAIIYGFAKSGEAFTGSRKYLSEWIGSSLSTVDLALTALIDKGYILKNKCGSQVEYVINVGTLPYNSEHKAMVDTYNREKMA